jgi:hypothetical protein
MPRTEKSAVTTTDHDTIRKWVEERGGHPASVKGTGDKNDPGLLRIDFPGYSGEGKLEEVSWDEFFKGFEDNQLAFLYEEDKNSRFSKLIRRDSNGNDSKDDGRRSSSSGSGSHAGGASQSSSSGSSGSRSKAGAKK